MEQSVSDTSFDSSKRSLCSESVAAAAVRDAIEAARRFSDANDFDAATRPFYILPYVENLALLMGRTWGLAFLEDCVLQQGRWKSTRRRKKRKGKQKKGKKAKDGQKAKRRGGRVEL